MAVQGNNTPSYLEVDIAAFTVEPVTVGIFLNAPNITGIHPVFFCGNKNVGGNHCVMFGRGDQSGDPLEVQVNAAFVLRTTTGFSANQYHHEMAAFDTSTLRHVYIDGGSKASDSTTAAFSGFNRTGIGRSGDSTPFEPTASVGFAYGVAWTPGLTDEEILAIGKGEWPFNVRPHRIIDYWPLMRKEFYDLVGNVNFAEIGTVAVVESPSIVIPMLSA